MNKIVIIETSSGKEEFEIDEFENRFHVFKLTKNFIGIIQSEKIGDAKSWNRALEIAKASITNDIIRTEIKEKNI